ncbi:hypothetical protein EZS27_020819 [termite gut metagenome]|uniref:Uncharacterized protein n=1 Tax=termite gut metagenome TaxID=433724 RepID=A0A5J4R9X0_9ZZZZ
MGKSISTVFYKLVKSALFLLFILFMGCEKDMPVEEYNTVQNRKIEVVLDDTQTRTTIDGDKIHWKEGDTIGMYSLDAVDDDEKFINNIPFVVKKNGNKIVFKGEMYWKDYETKTCTFFAYYPYNKDIAITNTNEYFSLNSLSLPENQVQSGENNNEHINTLNLIYGIAKIETNKPVKFKFDNVYTLLELKIKGSALLNDNKESLLLNDIKLQVNNEKSYLSFTNGIFSFYNDGKVSLLQRDKVSKFLNLHVEPSVQINYDEQKNFYLLAYGNIDVDDKVDFYVNGIKTPIALSPIDIVSKNQKYTLTIDEDKLSGIEKGTITINNGTGGYREIFENLDDKLKVYNLKLYDKIKISGDVTKDDFIAIKNRLSNFTEIDLEGCSIFGYGNATEISSEVFRKFSKLKKIILPQKLMIISASQFEGLSELEYVKLGKDTRFIYSSAFKDCVNLTNIENLIDDNLKEMRDYVFANCEKLIIKDFKQENIKTYGKGAFLNCKNLTGILNIQDALIIDDFAFQGCTGITSIDSNGKITSIGESAFEGCININGVINAGNLTNIGNYAFGSCIKLSIDITNLLSNTKLVSIGNDPFMNCKEVSGEFKNFTFDSVGDYAFKNYKNLTGSLSILKSVGDYAFSNSGEINVILGDKVERIGTLAFENINKINKIIEPSQTISSDYFQGIKTIDELTINSDSKLDLTKFSSADSIIKMNLYKGINIDSNNFKYVGVYHFYVEPVTETFNSINYDSEIFFHNVKNIPSKFIVGNSSKPKLKLHLISGVEVQENAFKNVNVTDVYVTSATNYLKSFTSLSNIPNNFNLIIEGDHITVIDNDCFKNVPITNTIKNILNLPPNLIKIGTYAFYGTKLVQVNIPASVRDIGNYAFREVRGGDNILGIKFNWTKKEDIVWRKEIFPPTAESRYIVPAGLEDMYFEIIKKY